MCPLSGKENLFPTMMLSVPWTQVLCKDLRNWQMPVSQFSLCFTYSYMYNGPEDAKQCGAWALAHILASSLRLLLHTALTCLGDSHRQPTFTIFRRTIPSVFACCTHCSIESCVTVAVLYL